MMSIVAAVTAALFVSTASAVPAEAAPSAVAIPPMIVNVSTTADMSPWLVAHILAEADAIWRPSGVTFLWQRAARVVVPYSRTSETGRYVPRTLRLTVGDGRGPSLDGRVPLGWILFDDVAAPEQAIYLSYSNALQMMAEARDSVGGADQMPISQRETLLARAMGRALAHELGHYLLASKVHTQQGLMKALLTAAELFSPETDRLRVEPAQRRTIAARLRGDAMVASS